MISKLALNSLSLALMLGALGASGSAFAADACAAGGVTIVRISKITPTGSMAGFEKAVADHAKWYADHGLKDVIVAAPILKYDAASKSLVKVGDQEMTFHMHSTPVPMDKHDAAWNAYVAEYRANSDITSETMACMPSH